MSTRVPALVLLTLAMSVAGWSQATAVHPRVIGAAWQNGYGQYPAYGQAARLSPDDQQKFDHSYQKWIDANRKNDRDDIEKNARQMQDIMARYNIPSNVPFAQIASSGGNGYASPANGGYGYPVYGQSRLSPDDERKFDDYYRKWMDATRKNDTDDIQGNARHMQDIMAHYNIPPNVPFDQIASNGTGGYGYQGNNRYPNGAYPPYGQSRLSADDQKKFDHYYQKWVDARRGNDRDDIDKNARHMQDIMAHYNIPANVPFDQIASAAANR